ncbi:MAG: SDR family oxidoreductase [Gammaproteobacteria bacterium]|nr:SDR family oxidoreductase [Gammaproteobacteria bacterium]MDH5691610.1 SDR family oxidoreductase [Gammaproteobacteria bacterium]
MEKSILITGCSSGIGLGCAQGLKKCGYRVFATARKAEDVSRLLDMGFEATQLDLDSSESINRAVDHVLDNTGGTLYALFNNGAYGQPGAVEDLSRDTLRKNFETNVFGTHELTARIIPVMLRQGYGRIVQNSSVLGIIALRFRGAYNASKFALEGLTDTLRQELSNTPIHVSLIEPGPISSRFRKNAHRKFLENIDRENSRFKVVYKGMENRLTKEGPAAPFTLPPEAVLKKLIHALESTKPKPRYYVTFPTTLFATLKRILPHTVLDKVLLKVSSDENQ